MMPRAPKVTATALKGLKRRLKALEYREQGLTYQQVGEKLGCSTSRAYKIIQFEYDRQNRLRGEKVEFLKRIEERRLDRLLAGLFPAAEGGDVQAVNAVLRVMERRAKLRGLDAPTEISGNLGLGFLNTMTDDELTNQAKTAGLDVPDELEQEYAARPSPPTLRITDHTESKGR